MNSSYLRVVLNYSLKESFFRLLGKFGLFKNLRYKLYLVPYAPYLFGIEKAVKLAHQLGEKRILAIEFGVAGGNGLLALQNYSEYFRKKSQIEIVSLGVDSGTGLPSTRNLKDLPYLWTEGDYPMDELKLRPLLGSNTKLILGDIKRKISWIAKFAKENQLKIGFISFDLDLFTSTYDALEILNFSDAILQPRIPLYFDDVVGTIPQIGQLAAINKFNLNFKNRAIGHYFHIDSTIPFEPNWANKFFEFHFFRHRLYRKTRSDQEIKKLPLNE